MAAALFQIAVKAVVNYFVDKRQQMQAHRQALKYLRLNGYQQKVDVEYVGAVEPRRRLSTGTSGPAASTACRRS
jgi:hypothetical protein